VSAVPTLGRPRTRKEAAAFLRCSVPTLDRRIKAGLLGCVRNGRLVLILDEHLEAFLARDTATAPDPVRTKPRRHPKYAADACDGRVRSGPPPPCDFSDEYFLAALGPEVVADVKRRVAEAPEPSPELVERMRQLWAPAAARLMRRERAAGAPIEGEPR